MDEARVEQTANGLVPAGDGWFTMNLSRAQWLHNDDFGRACAIENDETRFSQLGFTLHVLEPGQPNGLYHLERAQEDFVVLSGECRLLVEGTERPLGPWDFVHCPPGTAHIFVGAGDGPCVILMVGARPEGGETVYLPSELAARYRASPQAQTTSADEAYASRPDWEPGPPVPSDLPWS